MEQSAEQITTRLVSRLRQQMAQQEDAASAISTYKTANWAMGQLDEVKREALQLAERDMQEENRESLKTSLGSAGWTEPKAKQLDEEAWREALANNPRLMQIQREFDLAQAALEQAQQPFMKLAQSRFFIR